MTDRIERDLLAENQGLREQVQQVNQMLLTIIHAQPNHTVVLQEKDFLDLPSRPAINQFVDEDTGEVTIRVATYGD